MLSFRAYLLVMLVALNGVLAYRRLKSSIPNGFSVPSPCNGYTVGLNGRYVPNGGAWEMVGHIGPTRSLAAGFERNLFGRDFERNEFDWRRVCRLDSDGDGLTNGQELGDPNCEWMQGYPDPNSGAIGHPGYCDAFNDTARRTCSRGQEAYYRDCPWRAPGGSGGMTPRRNGQTESGFPPEGRGRRTGAGFPVSSSRFVPPVSPRAGSFGTATSAAGTLGAPRGDATFGRSAGPTDFSSGVGEGFVTGPVAPSFRPTDFSRGVGERSFPTGPVAPSFSGSSTGTRFSTAGAGEFGRSAGPPARRSFERRPGAHMFGRTRDTEFSGDFSRRGGGEVGGGGFRRFDSGPFFTTDRSGFPGFRDSRFPSFSPPTFRPPVDPFFSFFGTRRSSFSREPFRFF